MAITLAFSVALLASPCLAQQQYLKNLIDASDKYINARNLWLVADDSSWIPFVDSEKTKASQVVNGYLDRALALLLDDSVIASKDNIKGLYAKNKLLETEIARLNLEKIAAPLEKKFYEVWKDTSDDMDKKIAGLRGQINKNKALIDRQITGISDQLANSKINLSNDQVKTIFISPSGEDQLNSIVVLKNIYAICDVLKKAIADGNDLSVNKKYYAVFLLATEAHKKQLETNLGNIESLYLPRLARLQEDNQALMSQTRDRAADNPKYETNLIAQQQTQEVSEKFKDLLKNQGAIILDRLKALEDIIQFTDNTYQTVDLASSLSDSMSQSANSLLALLEMPIMPPIDFENSLESKFLEISEKINAN